jgi:coproporphyrinogen III oxidase-like Fe-S oxidoreductase
VAESEQLRPEEDFIERMIFGLRMTDGISLADTGAVRCGELLRKVDHLVHEGLLERRGKRVRLTHRGRRYADSVAVALLSTGEDV